MSKATSKNVSVKNVENTNAVDNKKARLAKFRQDEIEAGRNLRKFGKFFQGENGETVRAVILDDIPEEGITKSGLAIYKLKVLRMDVGIEQVMSWPTFNERLMRTIGWLLTKHDDDLRNVVIDAKFGITSNGTIVMTAITEVLGATIEKED